MQWQRFSGLHNTVAVEAIPPGGLAVARNVLIDDQGLLTNRPGRKRLLALPGIDGLYADADICLFRQDGALCRWLPASGVLRLQTGLHGPALCYQRWGHRVYFSDGVFQGVTDALRVWPWGLAAPDRLPAVQIVAGQLPAGRYLLALTHRRDDGLESAPGATLTLTLPAGSGLQLSGLPAAPANGQCQVYLSAADGRTLYHAASLADTPAGCRLDQPAQGAALASIEHAPPPAAEQLCLHGGRLWLAAGPMLHYSRPFEPEQFSPWQCLPLPAPITALASLDDGLLIGTTAGLWKLGGNDPEQASLLALSALPVRAGGMAAVDGRLIGQGLPGNTVAVLTSEGLLAVTAGLPPQALTPHWHPGHTGRQLLAWTRPNHHQLLIL